MADVPKVTKEQLDIMNKRHCRELRLIRRMSEIQFQAFRQNLSVGVLDTITRDEAIGLLTSMLALNLQIRQDIETKRTGT
ncbi:MAG TPA: hypothetical protein PKM25_05655 [Candidatus Ozemobacteraceae bacterium]|nr:hypothetical protein [Candidatus Ozemobacteraceae bacterium]